MTQKEHAYRDFALSSTCPACIQIRLFREHHPDIEIVKRNCIRIFYHSSSSVAHLLRHRSHIEVTHRVPFKYYEVKELEQQT